MIERHNLTLKMDMMEVLEAREKEVKFWKNKAMRLRRKVSTIEGNGGGAADLGAASSSSALEAEDPDQSSDGLDGVEQGLMARTTILERELQDREVQIESLRGIMDTQEKQSEERVRLLESQLERIVEIQSSIQRGSLMFHPRGSLGSSTADITDVMSDSDKEEHSSTRHSSSSQNEHSTHEVSALEQLLARVLAEKDRLSFENDNLRSVIRDARGGPEDKSLNKTLPTADGDENDVVYQLSCRLCEGNTYIGSASGQDLKKVAKDHFSTVWKIVSQDEGGSSNSHAKAHSLDITYGEYDDNNDDDDFRNKPLARHLAECHCHNLNTEEEVWKWCKKYVKLEKLNPGESDDMHRSCEF